MRDLSIIPTDWLFFSLCCCGFFSLLGSLSCPAPHICLLQRNKNLPTCQRISFPHIWLLLLLQCHFEPHSVQCYEPKIQVRFRNRGAKFYWKDVCCSLAVHILLERKYAWVLFILLVRIHKGGLVFFFKNTCRWIFFI